MKWFFALCLVILSFVLQETPPPGAILPVQHEGRVKPLDTVARVSSTLIKGKEGSHPTEWLLELLFNPEKQQNEANILIDHPELFNERYVSFATLKPRIDELYKQYLHIQNIDPTSLDSYQEALKRLWQRIELYARLVHSVKLTFPNPSLPYFAISPPKNFDTAVKWQNRGENLFGWDPFISAWPNLSDEVDIYMKRLKERNPGLSRKLKLELFFNTLHPFFLAKVYYLLAFITFLLAELFKKKTWIASSFLIAAFVLHTLGIAMRVAIEGRPPVTNLYSSALFVGWGGVFAAFILLKDSKSFMIPVAGMIGVLTLSISTALNTSGETMEMMRAVLDSNFWLSSHVITITLGYSATFLAGVVAAYSLLLSKETHRASALTYRIITLALVLSFVGTLLGGIWADQSWGRFWGWDPKENGALMIVLWNTIIVHLRIAGFVKSIGTLRLAVFGNIVTSFSWFGVNMLGIGLHSYGFIDQAFLWLFLFILLNIAIMLKPVRNSVGDVSSSIYKH